MASEDRKKWKRSGVNVTVLAPVHQHMPKHRQAKYNWRCDATFPLGVQLHARSNSDHSDAGDLRKLLAIPLAEGQIDDFISIGGKRFCQCAVPTLSATHSPREQAVINNANAAPSPRVPLPFAVEADYAHSFSLTSQPAAAKADVNGAWSMGLALGFRPMPK